MLAMYRYNAFESFSFIDYPFFVKLSYFATNFIVMVKKVIINSIESVSGSTKHTWLIFVRFDL